MKSKMCNILLAFNIQHLSRGSLKFFASFLPRLQTQNKLKAVVEDKREGTSRKVEIIFLINTLFYGTKFS
jgi:hypothetical protein